ncbi:PD-(D/E)XK nuclease domain-containing protein [Kineothrix sp. MSJ-39]|uniref:PD-(D/E)XK nuclease domain-containing protein n=1 Tax=Kineothrix sp. MSJ-39 TaxID=2841533 RepID=UPI00209EC357|nr:PD-(D/E)XK nuclease domain-containing protein [Kineothrix sp. MSJ-39]
MNMVAKTTFSYFDCGSGYGAVDETERFYHGFVLGLLAELSDRYHITSNRESGIGRYDIMMKAVDAQQSSCIIEFKVFNPKKDKDLEDCAYKALRQIEEKGYVAELLAEGIDRENIKKYGFAFEGKTVLIKQEI